MPKILNLETHSDSRGALAVIESNKHIPFEIKRIYYLFGNQDGIKRGEHAHKNLKQVYIAVAGSCKIKFDDGQNKSEFFLNNPKQGLLIENIVWREIMEMSPNCVLLVLASEHYNEEDYIRNHAEFLNYTAKKIHD